MSDNKTKRGVPDNKLISMKEPYEVKYWTRKYHISKAVLDRAIFEIGSHAVAEVEAWLRKHKHIK